MHDGVGKLIRKHDESPDGCYIVTSGPYRAEVCREGGETVAVAVARHGAVVAKVDRATGKMKFHVRDRVDRQIANTVLAHMEVALHVLQRVPLPDESFFNVGPFLERRRPGSEVVSRRPGMLFVRGEMGTSTVVCEDGSIPRFVLVGA